MSNLIITIISIALVSIAAIMAVFYVGPAFENAQAKAYANTIAQQAAQINNAIVQWQLDNNAGFLTAVAAQCGGSGKSTLWCSTAGQDPIANVLTPNWLQSMTPPDTNDFDGINTAGSPMTRWELSGSDNYLNISAGGATYGYFIFLSVVQPTTSTAVQVCNQIAIMARGPNAVPVHPSLSIPPHVYVTGENPVLDCYWASTSAASLNACIGGVCRLFIAAQANASF